MGLRVGVIVEVDALDGTPLSFEQRVSQTFNARPEELEAEPALAEAAIRALTLEATDAAIHRLEEWAATIKRAIAEGREHQRRLLDDDTEFPT